MPQQPAASGSNLSAAKERPTTSTSTPPSPSRFYVSNFGGGLVAGDQTRLDLRLADVLACQEYVFIERHEMALPSTAVPPAQSPFWARGNVGCSERPKGPERAETLGAGRSTLPRAQHGRATSPSASNRSA